MVQNGWPVKIRMGGRNQSDFAVTLGITKYSVTSAISTGICRWKFMSHNNPTSEGMNLSNRGKTTVTEV